MLQNKTNLPKHGRKIQKITTFLFKQKGSLVDQVFLMEWFSTTQVDFPDNSTYKEKEQVTESNLSKKQMSQSKWEIEVNT